MRVIELDNDGDTAATDGEQTLVVIMRDTDTVRTIRNAGDADSVSRDGSRVVLRRKDPNGAAHYGDMPGNRTDASGVVYDRSTRRRNP